MPPPGFLEAKIRTGRYFFPRSKNMSARFAVIGAGWEECHADFRIDRPSFRYHALELIDSGEWEVRFGRGKTHRLRSGGVFLYGPGTRCSVTAVGNGPHGKYFLDISGSDCSEVFRESGLREGFLFKTTAQGNLASLFEQLIGCANLTSRQADSLAMTLARAIFLRSGAERFNAVRAGGPTSESFERCRKFLEAHYTGLPGIAAAASSCHVSPEYFSRLFRKHTGTTAERYLKRLRLNQAVRLLQQSGFSVKEIALRVGFNDQFHFSKAFKSEHGLSPSHFRGRLLK